MSPVESFSRATPLNSRASVDLPTANAQSVSAPVSEREVLQARVDAGHPMTPVEHGTLARLAGRETRAKTVDDFTLQHATAKDKADLKAALEYFQQTGPDGKPLSPTAVALLNKLPAGTKINITHNGDDSNDPNTKTINWDPHSGLEVSSGAGTQSAALGLIHEMDHAANGQRNPTLTGDGYENTEEKRVITGSETQIAHDLGEPTRTDHYGTATSNEPSSTSHTQIDYPKSLSPEQIKEKVFEKAGEVVERVKDLLEHIF